MSIEPPSISPPTDEELLKLFEDGMLAAAISQSFGLDTHEDAVAVEDRCLTLHHAGRLDLLALIEDGLEDIPAHDFFTLQQFFNRALPSISADPDRVMVAVESLVAQGGEDLASSLPNAALIEWCKADPTRGQAIIDAAWAGEARAVSNLSFALQGIAGISETRRFIAETDDTRRLSGITAIGRIADPDSSSREESFRVLQAALGNGSDDAIAANVILAAAALAVQSTPINPRAADTIRQALVNPGDAAKNAAARLLWTYPALITPEILDIVRPALVHINPEHGGTIRELDMSLAELVRRGHATLVVDHLAAMFRADGAALRLSSFRSAVEAIIRVDHGALSRAICTWLLTGEPKLCEGLSKALSRHERDERQIDIDVADLPRDPEQLAYLCRKIVGWLFFQPRITSSALVSVLALCSSEAAAAPQALLGEVVLRCYGSIRDDLEALPADHPAKARVQECLALNDAYVEGLRGVGDIKELSPSERHRQVAHVHRAEIMREAQKSAEAQSPLLSMVRRSTILHGRRSLSFIRDPQGQTRPMEMELGTHSVSVEIPRLEVVDPIGLQLLLFNLRHERRPA